ncbi:MAG: TolB-like translocation protein, partial [Planctomycetota bacterium]
MRLLVVGIVAAMVLSGGNAKADFTFGEPTNLGPIVNSEAYDGMPCISADGLELYFYSDRGGGQGGCTIWVSIRDSTDNEWGPPENLGSVVNGLLGGWQTAISADGLELYVQVWQRASSGWPFTSGEIWLMRRAAKDEPWGEPVNLNLSIPGMDLVGGPSLTTDGLELHFFACRFGDDKNEANLYVTMRDTL